MTTTTTPLALRQLCKAARSVPCGNCAAPAGQPCLTSPGQEGYHLVRFGRARISGLITAEGMAAAIMAAGPVLSPAEPLFTPVSVITGDAS